MSKTTSRSEGRTLILTRLIDAPPSDVYQAWTDPAKLIQWFAPSPWSVSKAETDVRPGGSNLIVMRGPDGQEFPGRGVYLEVIENQKLVSTDAYTSAWEPAEKPFMTVSLTFEREGDATRYTAVVSHWSVADREQHEAMGFHLGWALCTEQLAKLVERT